MVVVDQLMFEVIEDYREGFKEEDFTGRYSDILSKYDYIVGDWGYGQLRLKGFYEDKNSKATYDSRISTVKDYLYEYCNFGTAYFIVKKVGKVEQKPKQEEVKEVIPQATENVALQTIEPLEQPTAEVEESLSENN